MSDQSAWGDQTQFFFELKPENVLQAVESSGLLCTGMVRTLNSLENRVYEVELEVDDPSALKSPSERFRVAKFYRPGRWSEQQILDEHEFLLDIQNTEIAVVAPLKFKDGKTLHQDKDSGIYYCVYAKRGGRSPDELNELQLEQVGRLIARIHQVGQIKPAASRLQISPEIYGRSNLEFLKANQFLPMEMEAQYERVVLEICDRSDELFDQLGLGKDGKNLQRVHGDNHFGNLLWTDSGPCFLDLDDMVRGPCVQDLWLLVGGRDQTAVENFRALMKGYESMRDFDRRTVKLIEPLRALRLIHFNGWIARRWEDPAFPNAFPAFGTHKYWSEQLRDLEELLQIISGPNDFWAY